MRTRAGILRLAVLPCLSVAAVLLAPLPAPAVADDWPSRFAEAFRTACVPQRLSYEGTLAEAKAAGWTAIDPAGHAEFGAIMARSAAAMEEEKADMPDMAFRSETFARQVEGRPLHLVVSFVESEFLDAVGCYLYDFEATEPVEASAVSTMLGIVPAQTHADETIVAHVWGPPPSMPRTLDTYMTFIPPGSPHVETTGFDGVVLKFSTSAPGEE